MLSRLLRGFVTGIVVCYIGVLLAKNGYNYSNYVYYVQYKFNGSEEMVA